MQESKTCFLSLFYFSFPADPEGPGCCALLLALVSILLIVATLPFSLCMCIKVRKEVGSFVCGKSLNGREISRNAKTLLVCISLTNFEPLRKQKKVFPFSFIFFSSFRKRGRKIVVSMRRRHRICPPREKTKKCLKILS